MKAFHEGDVIVHKTNHQRMTVAKIYDKTCNDIFFPYEKGNLFCRWYDYDQQTLKADSFSPLLFELESQSTNESSINIGSTVCLKSGSPQYIVLDFSDEGFLCLDGVSDEIEQCAVRLC